jgi:hypothetical protein
MSDLLLWTWVVGGDADSPDLIRRAVEWSRDATRSGIVARTPAARQRPASDCLLLWTRV